MNPKIKAFQTRTDFSHGLMMFYMPLECHLGIGENYSDPGFTNHKTSMGFFPESKVAYMYCQYHIGSFSE